MPEGFVAALARARLSGGTVASPPPMDVAAGYATAARLQPLLGEPAGWKVGATNAPGQRFLGLDEPIRGRIFTAGVLRSPAMLEVPGERACEVEPEIVLEVGADGGVARAFIGMEVNRPSRDDALQLGAGFIVADNAAHVAIVLGPELPPDALDDPAAVKAELAVDGEAAGEGNAAAVLGDPRRALDWLRTQVGLEPGELIATGGMCRAAPLARGMGAVARFGAYGAVEVCWSR